MIALEEMGQQEINEANEVADITKQSRGSQPSALSSHKLSQNEEPPQGDVTPADMFDAPLNS